MNTYIVEEQAAGETMADESIVEDDEAKKVAYDEAEADAMGQVAKVDEQVANGIVAEKDDVKDDTVDEVVVDLAKQVAVAVEQMTAFDKHVVELGRHRGLS